MPDKAAAGRHVTGTPLYMAPELLYNMNDAPLQSISTDLESLFYSFLQVATAGKLHGKYAEPDSPLEYDAKYTAMVCDWVLMEKVMGRIYLQSLRQPASDLERLLFPAAHLPGQMNVKKFLEILQRHVNGMPAPQTHPFHNADMSWAQAAGPLEVRYSAVKKKYQQKAKEC